MRTTDRRLVGQSKPILLFTVIFLMSGCVTSRVEQARLQTTSMTEEDALVVMGRASYNDRETEKSFTDCMVKALSNGRRSLRTVSEEEFRDRLYPWFEPRSAPSSPEDMARLLGEPTVRKQIEDSGIKYLAWIDGSTITTDQGGGMSCAVSTFGGGCFGMSTWEESATYETAIWDMEKLEPVGRISAESHGTSYMAGIVLPIPIIARPGNEACKAMAKQLKDFLLEGS